MPRRHPVPHIWLMTDERMGESLWKALESLPHGAGIVFRHYGLGIAERRALFGQVARIARRRRLLLVRAGNLPLRGEGGTHNIPGSGMQTRSAHTRRDAVRAQRDGMDAIFVSAVYPTRSHPNANTLGQVRLGLMIRGLKIPVIALGGMNARKARALAPLNIHGWAGIDAWTAPVRQKRKAVPI